MKKINNFDTILDFAPDAMVVVNFNGFIEFINKQGEKLFGYTKEELVGEPIQKVVPGQSYTSANENTGASSFSKLGQKDLKHKGKRKDLSEFPIEINLSQLESEEQLILVLKDISEKVKPNERFENLLEMAPDAIILVNKSGIIELVNLQTEKLFGYSKAELIGEKIEILMPKRYREGHHHHRFQYSLNPHFRPMGSGLKLYGRKKDKSEFPIEISLSPIENEGLIAASIRDVTEKFLNSYLINKTKQLEDFAYITSHNLRSPVSNLTSLLNFYKQEETEQGREELMSKFEITVEKLSETLNNLMDVLIIQQNANKNKSTLHFETIYNKVILNLESLIKSKDAEIKVDFSHAPTVVYSKIYLESILQNLISNALKYSSPQRKPLIEIKTSTENNRTLLEISDNGLGIDLAKYGSKVFGLNKVFHMHPDAKGVGLFITKAQVEGMGGEISVHSEVNVGSTFKIIF